MHFKKILSIILTTALILPDIGRCMDNDEPKRRNSLPPQLKKSLRETRTTKSRSLESRDLVPLKTQFQRFAFSSQKLPFIEQKFDEKHQTKGDLKPPLNLTELLQDCPIEPVSVSQETSKRSGSNLELIDQENNSENIRKDIPSPFFIFEQNQGVLPGDQSISPPMNFTNSSSSSPSKESHSNSKDTEDSDKSLTLSSSTESPRNVSSDFAQPEEQQSTTPTVRTSVEIKAPNEETQQGMEKEKALSLQDLTLDPLIVSQEESEKSLKQPSTDINASSEKVEKAEFSHISIENEKSSLLLIDNGEESGLSEDPSITVIKPERDVLKSLSITMPLTNVSPRGNEHMSSSRGNSPNTLGDSENAIFIPLQDPLGLILPLIGPTDILPLQAEKYENLSSPSSRDKSSDTLNTPESSSPGTSDSSKISLESLSDKSGSPSSDLDVVEEKPSVLLKPLQEEKLNFLNLNKPKREFPVQKKNSQKRASQDTIITNFDNHSDIGEKTSLLSNIRKPVKRPPEKKVDLTKDWEKLGTSEDELAFKRKSGSVTDDQDSISFEGDIRVSKKKVVGSKNSQALDEKSKKHILQRVVLEGSGSDEWSFELVSGQKGGSDYKGKELRSYPVNGDDSILLENEEKPWTKLIPDGLKGFIENEDLLSNIQVSLENEGSEEESSDQGPMVLSRARQYKLDQLLNDLPAGAKTDLLEIVNIWEKGVAMLVGAGIGGGTAYGIAQLWTDGIANFASDYDERFWVLLNSTSLFNYILAASLFDAAVRNAVYGKKALSSLSKRGANMWDVVSLGALSILPSLIAPFALISANLEWMDGETVVSFHETRVKQMLIFSPFLYLDSLAFSMDMASEMKANVKKWMETSVNKWAETSGSCFAPLVSKLVLYVSPPSEEEMRKKRFNKKLDTLIHHLPSLSDEKMREIYDTIQSVKTTIATELPELENLEAGVKFLTYRYVLSLGNDLEKMKQFSHELQEKDIDIDALNQEVKPQSLVELADNVQLLSSVPLLPEDDKEKNSLPKKPWYEIYEKVTEGVNYASLLIGSPIRLITLKYIVQEIFKAIIYATPEAEVSTAVIVFSWIIALVAGFPMQTGFEYKGMKNFAEMIWDTAYHGHESYPWARRGVKLYSVLQGLILTSPIGILALQACTEQFGDDWVTNPDFTIYKWMTFISIFSYLIPEWAVQTTLVEDSYNQKILTGAIDGGNQYILPGYNQCILPSLNQHIQPLASNYIDPLKSIHPTRAYQQDWLIRFIKKQKENMDNLHPQILFELEKLL
ncbi:MAG: hypothetical protein H0X26_09600 [Alphaproteobacteria bacterium]|nr:hypothetical protein [Alphaproteobacteria bacterium]